MSSTAAPSFSDLANICICSASCSGESMPSPRHCLKLEGARTKDLKPRFADDEVAKSEAAFTDLIALLIRRRLISAIVSNPADLASEPSSVGSGSWTQIKRRFETLPASHSINVCAVGHDPAKKSTINAFGSSWMKVKK